MPPLLALLKKLLGGLRPLSQLFRNIHHQDTKFSLAKRETLVMKPLNYLVRICTIFLSAGKNEGQEVII